MVSKGKTRLPWKSRGLGFWRDTIFSFSGSFSSIEHFTSRFVLPEESCDKQNNVRFSKPGKLHLSASRRNCAKVLPEGQTRVGKIVSFKKPKPAWENTGQSSTTAGTCAILGKCPWRMDYLLAPSRSNLPSVMVTVCLVLAS